jgi:hypothetical protein
VPVLEKQRHELFCNGIAKGLTPAESYIAAGFSANAAHASAWKLQQKTAIVARIAELQTDVARRLRGEADITNTEIAIAHKDGQVREKYNRWKALCQIRDDRIANYSDPANEMVRRLTGAKQGEMPNLRKLPGITTGFVVIEMRMVGKTAVPELRQDNALLKEMSALEYQIGRMMGFVEGMSVNVDARTLNQQINQTNVQIVKMASCPADDKGQW